MDSFERKGIMLAVGAHVALAVGMGAAFLFSKPVEAEEPPPVEVSIAGLGDALLAGAPDAELGGGGEEMLTPPPEDEVVEEEEAEPEAAPAPEPEPDPAPVVKPKPDTSAADKAKAERAAREKAAADKRADDKAAKDRAARDKAARDKAAKDKATADKAARDRAAKDKATADKAARDRAAKDKAAKDKAARDKAAADKAAKDKAARDKAAKDKAAADAKRKADAEAKAKKGKQPSGRLDGIGSNTPKGGGNDGKANAADIKVAKSKIGGQINVGSCIPSGVDVAQIVTTVTINLNQNGSLESLTNVSQSGKTASNTPQLKPVEQCVLSSIRKAAPFRGLDPDTYESWKTIRISFGAK